MEQEMRKLELENQAQKKVLEQQLNSQQNLTEAQQESLKKQLE
jgi:hypothetical protein